MKSVPLRTRLHAIMREHPGATVYDMAQLAGTTEDVVAAELDAVLRETVETIERRRAKRKGARKRQKAARRKNR